MSPSLDCLAYSLLCAEDNILYDDNDDGDDKDCEISWGHTTHHDVNQNQRLVKDLESEDSVLDFPLQSDEDLNLLLKKEREQFVGFSDYLKKLKNGKLDVVARHEAVDWITKVLTHFNFGPLTVYLSINYLDRFLAVYELTAKAWMMQLLAVACLSLAIKMEETETPLIVDLQIGGSRFVFEQKTIQKMELLVLTTLKWRMHAVTPFSFIDDFLVKVNGGQPTSKSLILTSTQLILFFIKETEFLQFRPSEIAAAVAIQVVGSTQISALVQHVQKEKILKCIDLLKELKDDCNVSLMSGTLTSMHECSIGRHTSCLNYAKRRRLNNALQFGDLASQLVEK